VNAPLTYPNSSLSIRFSGIAAQFRGMKGSSRRELEKWDRASQQILAGATLSHEQDGRRSVRHLLDHLKNRPHFGVGGDYVGQAIMSRQLSAELFQQLLAEFPVFQCARDDV